MYSIRVLELGNGHELWLRDLSFDEAVDRFIFYVRCACELGCSIRCVNLFKGKKSVKMFQNH